MIVQHTYLTLSRPGSGYTLWTGVGGWGEGGIMVPLVFQLQGYQKPKTEPWQIFGTKQPEIHFGQF